jgi:hypothetical protein
MGINVPIRLVEFYTMPPYKPFAYQLSQSNPPALGAGVYQQPPRNEQFCKPVDIRMFRDQAPIEPISLVVLTIRVIVSVLRSPHLIAH